jgi:long-chain acyl-CoA synthetase
MDTSRGGRLAARGALTAPGQQYELQPVSSAHGEIRWFVNLPQTLRELYSANATDKDFLVFGDERSTFREAYDQICRIAVVLQRSGVGKGDRVAISMRNYPEWMLSFAAATSIGAIAVGMNSLWQTDEMEYALRDASPRVLLADRERLDQFRSMSGIDLVAIPVRCVGEPDDLASSMAAIGTATMPDCDVGPDDPAVILYTSGSTGHPKGVLSSHRGVLAALYAWELETAETVASRPAGEPVAPPAHPPTALLAIPLFHVMGLNGGFLSSWRAQRRVVCMTKWDAAQAAELIERERVTSFSAPPAMTGDLVREGQRTARDLSSLVTVGGGGAARAPEQVRQIDSTFRRAAPSIGWGMTETNAAGTIISGAEYLAHPSAAGFRLSVVDLRIVDADDRPLPDGERGELQVRGAPMFLEYWNRPDAMASSFTADGWFRTGDVAHLDGDLLHIVDRIKDLIIRGGENIGCGHVEAALLAHPSVIEAAVYAVPDTRLGEEVGATVFGTSDLDLDELWEFLSQRLARHEVPRYIFTSDAPLARTATGKVLKRQLRDEGVERVRAEQG